MACTYLHKLDAICSVIYVSFNSPDGLAIMLEGKMELSAELSQLLAEFSKYQLGKIVRILASIT